MPKHGAFALSLTAIALVLLLDFQVPADATVESSHPDGRDRDGREPRVRPVPRAKRTTGQSRPTAAPRAAARRRRDVDGPVVDTRWTRSGSVTLDDGAITDVRALELPWAAAGQISGYAAPILQSEALQAQSASLTACRGRPTQARRTPSRWEAALDDAGYSRLTVARPTAATRKAPGPRRGP